MKQFVKKHRVVAFITGFGLALAAGASAAWIVFTYTGLSGSTTQSFDTVQNQTVGALTYSSTGAGAPPLSPGLESVIPIKVTNADPSNAHTVNSLLNFTISSSPSQCASHLSMADTGSVNLGLNVAAGGSFDGSIGVVADGSLPAACAGGTYTVDISGTTS